MFSAFAKSYLATVRYTRIKLEICPVKVATSLSVQTVASLTSVKNDECGEKLDLCENCSGTLNDCPQCGMPSLGEYADWEDYDYYYNPMGDDIW